MKPSVSLAAAALIAALAVSCSSGPKRKTGWTSLFDGKSLSGWVQRGGSAKFHVEQGHIVGTAVTNTPNSFLCTTRSYTNFMLELQFKVDAGLNSGVQLRSLYTDVPTEVEWRGKKVKVPANRVFGLQAEIDPSDRAWTAGVHGEGGGGWFNDLKANEPARKAFKSGQWNHLRIECQDDSIKTWLNGVPAADLKDTFSMSGFIGLQVHGVQPKDAGLQVRFRDIRVREL